ncbi:hypothetical protein LWE69_04015 [Paenibacillus sp. UKAQ_18]|nr:hypothetical protein [Paenibacillus sp. UKAQ_18]
MGSFILYKPKLKTIEILAMAIAYMESIIEEATCYLSMNVVSIASQKLLNIS